MKPDEILKARSADLRNSLSAMHRAAALARKTAIQTDTGIVVVSDGKLTRITAEQLRQEVSQKTS